MKRKFVSAVSALLMTGSLVAGSVAPSFATDSSSNKAEEKDLKNVIVMISDGWGENQILATNYFMTGSAGSQIYEKFPTNIFMSTYSLGDKNKEDDYDSVYSSSLWDNFELFKNNPTDSAAAGTAMATGVKTYDAAIGVDQDINELKNVVEDFKEMGRSTGVISSVQFSHATPASFVAHNESRKEYSELANYMLKESATDLIMGAGHPDFDDDGKSREEKEYKYVGGEETWKDLKDGKVGNDANGDGKVDYWKLIETKKDFEELVKGDTPDRVVGVPQVASTLQQSRSGDDKADAFTVPFNENVPTLEVMTKGALNVLDNNEEGFFLMVEGGAVDWTGHANQSGRLIEEQDDFNKSVDAVCDWVDKNSSWDETLVVVTGDHETGYLTGTKGKYDKVINNGKNKMPTMTWNSTDHTNQLIPFYAKGAGAEELKKLADKEDKVRGKYLDNTQISVVIRDLIKDSKPGKEYDSNRIYIDGYDGNVFQPDNDITRAEAAKVLAVALTDDFDKDKNYKGSFTDVPSDSWYSNVVNYMQSVDAIKGYKDGSFLPENKITRAEFASIISNIDGYDKDNTMDNFKDVIKDHWAKEIIESIGKKGYIIGYKDGSFKPENNISRAEVVTLVNRMLKKDKEAIMKLPNLKTFDDVKAGHWAYEDVIAATNSIK